MKRFLSLFLIMILISGIAFPAKANDEVSNLPLQEDIFSSQGVDSPTAMLGVGQLVKNVRAAFLYESNSDTLMYALNPDEQLYPASFVKLMTALLAVEKGNLDEDVTVTSSAINAVPADAVSADLVEGEILTLKDLLYCMLVGSANDAAAVIAEHISGSQEAFVSLMNQRAQEMGCLGTQFTNAHGLHDDSQLTTARDAARILDAALDNALFYDAFTAVKYQIPATNKSELRTLITGNYMMDTASALYYDERVIGGRTGVTNDGRRCFIAAAESNGMRLISVVMGAESVFEENGYAVITIGGFNETAELFDAGFNGYKTAQILYAGQILKQCTVNDGKNDVYLGSRISVSTVLPEDAVPGSLNFRYAKDTFQAPIEAGQKLTTLEVWHGSMCVARTDMYAMNSVQYANSVEMPVAEENPDQWKTIGIVIVAVLAVAFVVYITIKAWGKIRSFVVNSRSKRYRRNRRRSK